ncbi:Dynactin subunit 2 [Nymphon striatum]|nr:Dynactin subunit 2 [Nymphon striatum]
MANPKYADLPGIAFDQPDVFETSDLPESDQMISDRLDDSESVDKLNVSTKEAYEKFKGKTIDSESTDFSDRITSSLRTGYSVQSGEWEMLGDKCDTKETPNQRYQRLQHELRELMEEVNEIKKSAKDDTSDKSPINLCTEVESLQKDLLNLNLQEVLGTEILGSFNDPDGSLKRQLWTQIDNFKSGKSSKPAGNVQPPESSDSKQDSLAYRLYYKPEISKHFDTAKAANLEKRLNKLESIIGKDTGKLSSIVGEMDHKNIITAVRSLSSKLALLDPTQLDHMDTRLNALQQKLSQVIEKKSSVEDSDKLSKVAELYKIMKDNEPILQTLPDIVERMVCLEELHKQALQFSQALNELDNAQQQVTLMLKNNENQLKMVGETFGNNMDMIKANVSNLDSRLSNLKK